MRKKNDTSHIWTLIKLTVILAFCSLTWRTYDLPLTEIWSRHWSWRGWTNLSTSKYNNLYLFKGLFDCCFHFRMPFWNVRLPGSPVELNQCCLMITKIVVKNDWCLQDTYVNYRPVLQWAKICSDFFTSWKNKYLKYDVTETLCLQTPIVSD